MSPQVALWETVTPAKAEKWLNANTHNRRMRPGVAEKYSADMKAGHWHDDNPQPMIFYDDGMLADGQHRLWAVIDSGCSMKFLVVRGMPREAALTLDTGQPRTLVDNAKIAGWDRPISKFIVSITTTLASGAVRMERRSLSNAARLELLDRYEAHVLFAAQNVPGKRLIGSAVIGAALARAHMHEKDEERLRHFCVVLGSGMPEDNHDSACIALRNYIFTKGHAAAQIDRRDTFLKAMNAIHYFMRRRALSVIRSVSDEAYPLPNGNTQKHPTRDARRAAATRAAA